MALLIPAYSLFYTMLWDTTVEIHQDQLCQLNSLFLPYPTELQILIRLTLYKQLALA